MVQNRHFLYTLLYAVFISQIYKQMEKVKVLLGSFTFLEPELNYPKRHITRGDGVHKAIVHRIDKEIDVLVSELDDFCEKSLETYEGYLIPSMYNGVIQNSI